jgi:hypothetical protein
MSTAQTSVKSSGFVKPSIGKIARAGLTAGVIAAVINTVVWFIGNAIDTMSILLPATPIASLIGVAAGGVLYTILSRFTSRANTIFTVIAVIFLILQIFPPIGAMSAPPMAGMPLFNLATVVATEIMHLVAGVLAIVFYTRTSAA